ncbi:MAG: hypothetical protein PHI63_00555 [Patescibacteria group bacterium]|nr:hypothetical protein [Patescibacteria group bacterium]
MTLMITSLTLAIAINLAAMIITGIRISGVSSITLTKFYRAESGMERALFKMRRLELQPAELGMSSGCKTGLTVNAPTSDTSYSVSNSLSGCSVVSEYPTTGVTEGQPKFMPLLQEQSAQVDIIDLDELHDCGGGATTALGTASCVDNVRIRCDSIPGYSLGSLAVSYWQIANQSGWGPQVDTQAPVQQARTCGSTFSITLDPSSSYVVKLRAVRAPVNVTWVRAYRGSTPMALSSRLKLTGEARDFFSTQRVMVLLPGRAPTSGLADYVLYSECGINKKTPLVAGDQTCP